MRAFLPCPWMAPRVLQAVPGGGLKRSAVCTLAIACDILRVSRGIGIYFPGALLCFSTCSLVDQHAKIDYSMQVILDEIAALKVQTDRTTNNS